MVKTWSKILLYKIAVKFCESFSKCCHDSYLLKSYIVQANQFMNMIYLCLQSEPVHRKGKDETMKLKYNGLYKTEEQRLIFHIFLERH